MTTVGKAVAGLADFDRLIPVLAALGTRHVGYGIQPAHYDIVGAALLWTLGTALGSDWTPEAEAAWSDVYGVVAKTMKGTNYN